MKVAELAEGLWWWTGRLASGQEVGSVYSEEGDRVFLLDPIVPPEDAARFLDALDRDLTRFGGRGEILLTSPRHRRDADVLAARYPGVAIADAPSARSIAAFPAGGDEVMYLLRTHAALFVGDALVGTPSGLTLRAGATLEFLAPLLDLHVERVLVSHGPPLLSGGADAVRGLFEAC